MIQVYKWLAANSDVSPDLPPLALLVSYQILPTYTLVLRTATGDSLPGFPSAQVIWRLDFPAIQSRASGVAPQKYWPYKSFIIQFIEFYLLTSIERSTLIHSSSATKGCFSSPCIWASHPYSSLAACRCKSGCDPLIQDSDDGDGKWLILAASVLLWPGWQVCLRLRPCPEVPKLYKAENNA
jgi:hypothetical protein